MTSVPFSFGRLVADPNFTDRESETARLLENLQAGTNTILISPRRWGKSSLVQRVIGRLAMTNKDLKVVAFDLFTVRSAGEFYKTMAEEVVKASHTRAEKMGESLKKFVTRVVPKLSFSVDSAQDISLGLDWQEVAKNPDEILDLAENICEDKGIRMLICIDEFQNLAFFDDPLSFQKKLRARWQRHKHVTYCLYGSKRHMMMEVFAKSSMPFYKFGDLIFLEKIALTDWVPFLIERFESTGKSIDSNTAAYLAQQVENHPYYVQQLAQLSWLRTNKKCSIGIVDDALESLTLQLSNLFQTITDGLATTHIHFLKALLTGEVQLSSKRVIDTYGLGTTANIARIKKALLEKEIIDLQGGKVTLADPVYSVWLRKFYFRLDE